MFVRYFYIKFFSFFLFVLFVGFLLVGISFLFATRKLYSEKLSPYECGFNPFDDTRNVFDVRFYRVAILFIIFDLEVMYLLPWSLTLGTQYFNEFSFWSMMFFLIILTLGFVYEWNKGALDWE